MNLILLCFHVYSCLLDRNSGQRPPKSLGNRSLSPQDGPWQCMPSSCKVQHAMDAIRNARDRVTDEIRDDVHLDDPNMDPNWMEYLP